MLVGILRNPAYADAFVYGRTRSCHATYPNGKLITARCQMNEWKIIVKDRYPAYFLLGSQGGPLYQHLPADLIRRVRGGCVLRGGRPERTGGLDASTRCQTAG